MDKIYPLDDYIASGVVDVSGIGDANLKTCLLYTSKYQPFRPLVPMP